MTRRLDTFSLISNQGRADEGDSEERWTGSLKVDLKTQEALWEGKRFKGWNPETRVSLDSKGPVEDMPWTDTVPVVSARVRTLLHRHAPRQVQFLAVRMMYRGKELDVGRYWVANYLCVPDCYHRTKSQFSTYEDRRGLNYSFDILVVDPSRVPKDVQIFRVKHYETTSVVRRELREVFEQEGITGVQFYPVF